MKKIILILALFVVLVSSLAFAYTDTTGEYTFNVKMYKGWNLYPETVLDYCKLKQDAVPQDIMSILSTNKYWGETMYLYVPSMKKYLEFDGKDDELVAQEAYAYGKEGNLHLTPNWIYFNKDMVIELPFYSAPIKDFKYYSESEKKNVDIQIKLSKGWNFFTITPHFYKKELTQGTCDVTKVYEWIAEEQKWDVLDFSQVLNNPAIVGTGIIIKVAEDCEFSRGTQTPPALPN